MQMLTDCHVLMIQTRQLCRRRRTEECEDKASQDIANHVVNHKYYSEHSRTACVLLVEHSRTF